jgi:peptidyl-tRNA hydrolase
MSSGQIVNKTLVQYIVLRSDLKWPLGALITQCCHASSAAFYLNLNDTDGHTQEYFKNLDSMHKITLAVNNEADLLDLDNDLKSNGIQCKLWIEQPECIPTALATKPYPKHEIEKFFKKFKLFK